MILKAFIEKNQKYKTRSGLEIDRFETYIKVSQTNFNECQFSGLVVHNRALKYFNK